MLYKPKFMSPDLNMDVKWAYYDEEDKEGNIKPVIFSCVCDGNSKIKKMDLELTWSDIINEKEYYFKKTFSKDNLNLYPIDYNNEYVPIELSVALGENAWDCSADKYSTDKNTWSNVTTTILSVAQDKQITAKYILTSTDGQEVYNYATFYFKSKPSLQILIKEDFATNQSELSSSRGEFYISDLQDIIVQYYYWEVYNITQEENSQHYEKIYQSSMTYSQNVRFVYDNFVNLQNYLIKCNIATSIGESLTTTLSFKCIYNISLLSITDVTTEILNKETGVYFDFNIDVNSARVYNSASEDISQIVIGQDYRIKTDNVENLVGTRTNVSSWIDLTNNYSLLLPNLQTTENIVYWGGYIHPLWSNIVQDTAFLEFLWKDNNEIEHKTEILKTNDNKIKIKDNGDVLLSNPSLQFQLRGGLCWWYILETQLPPDGDMSKLKLKIFEFHNTYATYPSGNLIPGSSLAYPKSGRWTTEEIQKKGEYLIYGSEQY